ncbi:GPI transamidase component Tta1 [Angomonas deanei]|nr:GPI transamidase component Tta1 [Angomonas deanei]|eukprot:EPY18315.1 GPI transamidase component Tta1 [Angomonas deanei]
MAKTLDPLVGSGALPHRNTIRSLLLFVLLSCVGTLALYFYTLYYENSTVSLSHLMEHIDCHNIGTVGGEKSLIKEIKENHPEEFKFYYDYWVEMKLPPPSLYHVAMWTTEGESEKENKQVLDGIHDTLNVISERLSHYTKQSSPQTKHGANVLSKSVRQVSPPVQESLLETPFATEEEAIDFFGPLAAVEQGMLPSLRHTSSTDNSKESELFSISFFTAYQVNGGARHYPKSLFPFLTLEDHVWCAVRDVLTKSAFCVFFEESFAAESGPVAKTVEAALSSLLADFVHVKNFRKRDPASSPTDHALLLFEATKQLYACQYATRSIQTLMDSLKENVNVHITADMVPLYSHLEELIFQTHANHHKKKNEVVVDTRYVLLARAADNLRLHPMLTPQLSIPPDQMYVSHATLLLPFLLTLLMAMRFLVEDRRGAKAAAKTKVD